MKNSSATAYPAEQIIFSSLILLFPLLTLTTSFGVGLAEACLLIGTLVFAKRLWQARQRLFHSTRWIFAAFGIYLGVAVLSIHSFTDELNFLDNPFRQLLAVFAIGLVAYSKPKLDWFWYGVFLGTLGAALFAIYQRFYLHLERAGGYHLVIMFGDIAMALGLMSLAGVQRFAATRLRLLPYFAFLLGIGASLLSESRGGWIALPLAALPFWRREWRLSRVALLCFVSAAVLLALAALSAEIGVGKRLTMITEELAQYRAGNVDTSIGLRVEMWRGAWHMFLEHPIAGVGRAHFNTGLRELVARGELAAPVAGYYHAHNEFMHALATQGLLGVAALMALYAAPLHFFLRRLRKPAANYPFAVAGVILVASTFLFGLTMVFFAHHVGAGFYAVMLAILCGICIAEETREEQNGYASRM